MTDEGAVFMSVLPDSGIAYHTPKRERGDRQTGGERGWERERERQREREREREREEGRREVEGGREGDRDRKRKTHINILTEQNSPLPPPTPKKKTTTKLVAMQTIRQNKHFRKRCRRQRIQKNTSCTLSSDGLGSR